MRIFLTACSLVLLSLFTACNDEKNNTYNLRGEAKGFEDNTDVYIFHIQDNQPQPIDTLQIVNESFSGDFKVAKTGDIYFLRMDQVPASILFFPETEDLNVTLNKEEPNKSKITGNTNTESYYKYLDDISDINSQMADLNSKAGIVNQKYGDDSPEMQALIQEMMELRDLQADVQKTYVKNNSNSIYSVILVQNLLQMQAIDTEEAEKMLSHLTPAIANHPQTESIKQFIAGNKTNIKIGSVVPDFSANTPEGEKLALSEVLKENKYVLIDFWAAWCAPCRRENPNLVRVYDKYHSQGFTILGVSLDRSENEWLQAIKKDKLAWQQISNLQFWEDPIAKEYNIRSIPASFLVDSEGKVLAKDLRGSQLDEFVANLVNETN